MNNADYPVTELSDREAELISLAKRAAEDSPDRSRKVGAVIVDGSMQVLTTGCNTLPLGLEHSDEHLQRPDKYEWTEHAERNALYAAAKEGKATAGCTMVMPWFPCIDCARAIVQSGITRVIAQFPDLSDPTWGPGFAKGLKLFAKAGVQFDAYVDHAPMASARAEGDHAESVANEGRPSVEALVSDWNARQEARAPRKVRSW